MLFHKVTPIHRDIIGNNGGGVGGARGEGMREGERTGESKLGAEQ